MPAPRSFAIPRSWSRETGFIDVEMDARQFKGAKAVSINTTFGGQKDGKRFQSTAILQVRAFSRTDVSVTPGQISFGTVAQGQQTPPQTVDIQYAGQQINWQITGVDDTNAQNVKVAMQRTAQGRGTTTYRLTATLKPDAASGALQDQIVLKTNDPTSPLLTIPVSGMVHAPLAVVQGMDVRLDPVPVGQETRRVITVRAIKPFRIVKIEGEGDGLTVSYQAFTAPGAAGDHHVQADASGRIETEADDSHRPEGQGDGDRRRDSGEREAVIEIAPLRNPRRYPRVFSCAYD